jgi:acyl carrier protein
MDTLTLLRKLFPASVTVPEALDAPLDLPSFELIVLAEEMESAFGFRVQADDLSPENFGTLAGLVAFVERKRTT